MDEADLICYFIYGLFDMAKNKLTINELRAKFPAALDYLSEIFLINRDYGEVMNIRLSKRLGVSKPAVTQAINRLKRLALAEQSLYGSINLTSKGRALAAQILKRHYLIEHLLIRKLDYPWEKSDEEAKRIQVSISDEFTDYLYEIFNKPLTCPHGNPFPGAEIEKKLISAPRISAIKKEAEISILRITEEGEALDGLLRFCNSFQLRPGAKVLVIPEEDKFFLKTEDRKIELPKNYAGFICYERLDL